MDVIELSKIFEDVYFELGNNQNIQLVIRFYKYSTIKSTIKKKENKYFIRISDILDDAPKEVIKSLAIILFSKIKRLPVNKITNTIYKSWVNSEYISKKCMVLRINRVNNIKVNPIGTVYNLNECFESINNKYFESVLAIPKLTWSTIKTYRKFGHYDPARHLISISKTLDSLKIPKFVLDYVLYHEMLHIVHDSKYTGKSQIVHHKDFKADEKLFEKMNEAQKWLKISRFF
ncbi:MAG: hypothetical protein K0B02_02050 [DPANN group archaeon]|nr:hypothetical protein [DPANN group archaeon]